MSLPIPQSAREVTAGWLGEALGLRVESVDLSRIGEGDGLVGELWRVIPRYAEPRPDAPASLVLKLVSSHPATRSVFRHLKFYEREVRFYRELASTLPIATASCLHAALAPRGDSFVLVLEDLGHLRAGDQLVGCGLADAEAVVDTLARLHAHAQQSELDWAPRWGDAADFSEAVHRRLWPRFLEQYGTLVPSEVREIGDRLGPRLAEVKRELGAATTLLHGDLRLGNVFFARDGGPVVIDWQNLRRGPGAWDLAYFLAGSLPIALRRSAGAQLTARYLDGLAAAGVRCDPDRFERELRLSLLDQVSFYTQWSTMDLTHPRAAALAREILPRFFAALLELDAASLLAG
jgi:hypothetical protein